MIFIISDVMTVIDNWWGLHICKREDYPAIVYLIYHSSKTTKVHYLFISSELSWEKCDWITAI